MGLGNLLRKLVKKFPGQKNKTNKRYLLESESTEEEKVLELEKSNPTPLSNRTKEQTVIESTQDLISFNNPKPTEEHKDQSNRIIKPISITHPTPSDNIRELLGLPCVLDEENTFRTQHPNLFQHKKQHNRALNLDKEKAHTRLPFLEKLLQEKPKEESPAHSTIRPMT
jgi:hypothetical protein